MITHMRLVGVGLLVIGVWLAQAARAEVTSVRGSAAAEVREIQGTATGTSDSVALAYPDPDPNLPLQAVAQLTDPNETAAGVAAAQFADPRTASGPDPDEFAIDIALSSISPDVHHTATGKTEEIRGVRFTPSEVGAAAGEVVRLTGRMYVDGALAIFAGNAATDLTGASVLLRVTITKEVSGQEPQTVFSGTLHAAGGADRQVTIEAGGRFPQSSIFTTDLAGIDPQLSVFRVYIFPNLVLDYPFDATVDEEFVLRATVEVEATNAPGDVGVAGVIGTPLQSITDVVGLTQGSATAQKMTTALKQERTAPTGEPAFPTQARQNCLFCGCGLFGLESLLGMAGLLGLRSVYGSGARRRVPDSGPRSLKS